MTDHLHTSLDGFIQIWKAETPGRLESMVSFMRKVQVLG